MSSAPPPRGRAALRREREEARRALLARRRTTRRSRPVLRIAVFGGVYSNRQALAAFLADAAARGAEAIYCLGDLGAFGPHPEACWPLLMKGVPGCGPVRCLQGNYEQSLASGREDCNCGYTDPRDNHFARLSYQYTARSCSDAFKAWMGALPPRRRVRLASGGREHELLLVHGSPRRVNEFLFASTTPVPLLAMLCAQQRCDGFLCTHTGLPWQRRLPTGEVVANAGVLGRPANDGDLRVRYAMVSAGEAGVEVEIVRLAYDHQALAAEMRQERLRGVRGDGGERLVDDLPRGAPAREREAPGSRVGAPKERLDGDSNTDDRPRLAIPAPAHRAEALSPPPKPASPSPSTRPPTRPPVTSPTGPTCACSRPVAVGVAAPAPAPAALGAEPPADATTHGAELRERVLLPLAESPPSRPPPARQPRARGRPPGTAQARGDRHRGALRPPIPAARRGGRRAAYRERPGGARLHRHVELAQHPRRRRHPGAW